jgi:hypothetical protein
MMRATLLRMPAKMIFTSLGGLLTGAVLVLSAPGFMGPLLSAWDATFPVIEPVRADLVSRNGDEVVINIVARKTKGDECKLLRLYGYGIDRNGIYSLATVRRPDGATHLSITHGQGTHDFGLWRIKPTSVDATKVEVYVEHVCLGRVIKSQLAEVDL